MSRTYADFFSDAHRASIDRMCQSLGDHTVAAMLDSMSQDRQVQLVESFALHIRDSEARVSQLTQAGQILEESLRQSRAEHQSSAAAVASMTAAMRPSGPSHFQARDGMLQHRPVKLEVAKYGGSEGEKLLHWIFQVKAAADALLIPTDTVRIQFAVSHLKDRAQHWAYSLLLANANYFETFEAFIAQLKAAFLPPNSDFRHHSKYLACKQGRRSIREFVHELRYLAASLADESRLPETTRVAVFMNGLNPCAARTQLFRTYPKTFEEAVATALSEEFSHSLASPSRGESSDMDISHVTADAPASNDRKCYSCGQTGHFARSCPRRQRDQPANGRRVRFARGLGSRQPTRPQGNGSSQ